MAIIVQAGPGSIRFAVVPETVTEATISSPGCAPAGMSSTVWVPVLVTLAAPPMKAQEVGGGGVGHPGPSGVAGPWKGVLDGSATCHDANSPSDRKRASITRRTASTLAIERMSMSQGAAVTGRHDTASAAPFIVNPAGSVHGSPSPNCTIACRAPASAAVSARI